MLVRTGALFGVAALAFIAIVAPLIGLAKQQDAIFEAPRSLGGLASAMGEHHGSYSPDIAQLHWRPRGAPRFVLGFCAGEQRSSTADPAVARGSYSTASIDLWLRGRDPCDVIETLALATSFGVTATTFRAYALADLDGDPGYEVWRIDEQRRTRRLVRD